MEIRRAIIVSTIATLAVFFFIYYSETSSLDNIFEYWTGIIVSVVIGMLVSVALVMLSKYYGRYLPWNRNIALRMFVEVLTGIFLVTLGAFLFIHFYLKLMLVDLEEDFNLFIYEGVIKFAILSTVIIAVYGIISFYLFSFSWYNKGKIEVLTSDKDQMALRLDVLKSQLSPHFLFNSLNTVSSLAYANKNEAESFIRQLSTTFSYILSTRTKSLVALKDELEMIKAYVNMFRIKYGDSIKMDIECSAANCSGFVVPLTLQILVENAIKHNYCDKDNPLYIIIKVYKGRIVVSNSLNLKENKSDTDFDTEKSFKIGLVNIISRYGFLTEKKVEIEKNKEFKVKIPLISNEN